MEQRNDLVVCEGLTKIYGSIRALDSLSLTLERGRFIGLLGPNGSGKTTAIKLLNGLLQPTSGTVLIDGEKVNIKSPMEAMKHGIGMVHQEFMLIDGYDVINGASETGELNSSEFDVTFDNLCANGNIAVMIISSNRAIVRSSVNDNQVILMEFMNILFGDDRNQTEILQRSDNYVIQKQTDTRLSSEYMVLYGTLSNGNLILMRTAVESIRESAKISNQFLVYVGVLAIAISAIVTVFVSKRITTPISELTDISKRMTELDFDAKYVSKGHRKNEIDELGEHFNRLSCALESTISELKSANNELKQDIEKKTEIDEMRKEFLSNVSHELKTPLALIQAYSERLD